MTKNIFTVILFLLVLPAAQAQTPVRFADSLTVECSYPDPPHDHRHEVLPLYIAWNGAGGEAWDYVLSPDSIMAEGSPPPQPADDGNTILLDDDPPGGRTIWFWGIAPGDVEATFTTVNAAGKTVFVRRYIIRVYQDLKLAVLHDEYVSYRNQ